ncbi:DUF5719 family protein [Microbacterium yannicii]|uniref:DUF5719 family protein n=1 Tax=Microbacterium yannicii TaxID=671622 RepID=UPI000306F39F|nr:DUF5719 family protein [Microbacterium yannicii]
MSDRRVFRWATTSTRMLIGTVVSVAAVILVVTAVSVPWPTLVRDPVSIAAVPAPAASIVACDGGLLFLGRDPMNAAAVSAVAPQSVTAGASEGAPEPQEQVLEAPGVTGDGGPLALTAAPLERARVDVAAAGSSTIAADDMAGFAASACRPPLLESWLVGGSGTTGASDLVLLSNPGTVAATVELTVFGAAGAQSPPGGSDLIVAPGSQRLVPLAGIALDEASPVIRVSATGAPVHASLQTSITRTLTPGGVDQVGPVTQPEATQTITGIAVTDPPGVDGASDAATVLRVLAPSADGTVQVTVTPVGRAEPAIEPEEVPLTAGQPVEVALPGLAVGSYSVEITGDVPVVSAVWQATGFEEGDDFAWYTPSPEIAVPSLFAAPGGPPPTLTVANPASGAAVVVITSDDGAYRLELTVPAQSTMTARLSARTVYLLEPSAPVRASLSLSGDGALAGMPVWPADAASPEIMVYP